MRRYELSISPTYVKDWGLVQAIRELFQNALDQEIVDPENRMGWSHDYDDDILYISSAKSSLDKSSLLLGNSSKSDDPKTIGKFGEGYKLALLVLTRMGYKVKILNYGSKEIWTPKIINSKRYNSLLLVVDVEKFIFKSVPDNNLTFVIEGVGHGDMHDISNSCLFMQKPEFMQTSFGRVLTCAHYKGKVYVNGLFVCENKDTGLKFGYDLKAEYLTLDRDRRLIDSFNLKWMTSELWADYAHIDYDFVADLVISKAPDVEYLKSHGSSESLSDKVFSKFQLHNGLTSAPVSTEIERSDMLKNFPALRPVIAPSSVTEIINGSSYFRELKKSTKVVRKTPYEILSDFLNDVIEEWDITNSQLSDLESIVEKSKRWTEI